jgi:hypothetical protein
MMARYKMDSGAVVNTDKATEHWAEATRWDGRNHVSVATGSQWRHETLYRSLRGNYYVETTSQNLSEAPGARFVTPQEAASWLLQMGHELPEDIAHHATEVEE